jgi:hypothetical protein
MSIVDQSGLIPIGTPTTIAQIQVALTALLANLVKINSFGLGVYSPIYTPLHPTSNYTIDPQVNGQMQSIGVRSSTTGLTITFPAFNKMIDGSTFIIFDETLNSNTYNITINPNGNKINGSTSNKTINVNGGYLIVQCFSVGLTQSEFITLGSSGVS